jgi:hypothetical protein
MRVCRTCRLEKPLVDFIRNFLHCNNCITKYREDWERRNKMNLYEYLELDEELNQETPVGGGVVPNYKPK